MVYRYKGFDSAECGDSMAALEATVNAWMECEHPRIRHMSQCVRGEHILLSFVYEDGRELEYRVSMQAQRGATGGLPRIFDDEPDERPTSPGLPVPPQPPMQ